MFLVKNNNIEKNNLKDCHYNYIIIKHESKTN